MPELISPLKPSRTYGFVSLAVLAVAAIVALAAAWGALVAVERTSRSAVERALFLNGEDWAAVEVNGLQVILSGDAPTEAARFAALSAASHEVDGARVIDQMALPEAVAIEPPRFSVEMLRNEAGISLIGLIPAASDREALTRRMRAIDPIQPVADFLETAEFPTPDGWDNALDFALDMAALLPRSKISMSAENVTVEAIAAAPDQKREWEQEIRRKRPAGLRLALDIRAPLDVVSPYILRFLSDEQGARFDACTAYTTAGRNMIVSAGIAAGVKGGVDCKIGLGVPSPDWPQAVARGIRAVRDMGGGSLTFSDADITLIAPADTPQDTFDRVVGELEADLPEVFSLHSVLTEPETGTASPAGTPEFIASLAKSGAVQLRGRVATEQDRTIVETLARARFGIKKVYAPLRLDPGVPDAWAVRTLAGLEALDQLAEGRVVVRPDVVTVTGTTGDKQASAEISRLLSEKLGEAEDFRVNVRYEEALDPIAAMPTPQECAADVNAALNKNKITFAPGSAEIERSSLSTVDRIAEILKTCPDVAMEIGGYTDSQGREEMNQALSQRRAEAVVSALLARRVLTTNLKAFGYGEENPIADNDTEDGREANRRIEFTLVGETRPRGEPDAEGDDPTIRPPSRPETTEDAAAATEETGSEDAGTEGTAEEDSEAESTGPEDAAADDTVPDGALTEGAAAPGRATDDAGQDDTAQNDLGQDDIGQDETGAESAAAEGAAVDQETSAETADTAAERAMSAGDAVPDAAPEADPEVDPGTAPDPVSEADVAKDDATGEAVAAQQADPVDAATQDVTPAGETAIETQAETPAEDPGAGTGAPETAPESPVAEDPETGPPGSVSPAPAQTVDSAGLPEGAETDAGEPATPEGAAETGTVTDDLDATAIPEGVGEDEISPATQSAETTSPQGPDETAAIDPDSATEVPGAEDAGDAAAAVEDPVSTEPEIADAEAGAEAENRETPSSEAGEAALNFSLDIPAIRPRARPPLVVHPDLAGVRPKPRPAEIPAVTPAAPTTE